MFAVPGWSVSSSELKPQTETPAAKDAPKSRDTDGSFKKRKREPGADDDGGKVTKSNVNEMWKRYIEGEIPKPKKPRSEKKVAQPTQGKGNKIGDAGNSKPDIPASKGNKKAKKSKKDKTSKKEQQTGSNMTPLGTREPSAVSSTTTSSLPPPPPPLPENSNLTPLQQSMRQKLISARFRHLNETLYTTPSTEAMELFTSNPEMFAEYHAGFSRQVKESWPSNPVDEYIKLVKIRGEARPVHKKQGKKPLQNSSGLQPLPRRSQGLCTIADMGCGDAQFARALSSSKKAMKLKIHSFDLHAPDSVITKADIANVPLEDGKVDVVIFCLSLMGTNWVSFVEEAWRVLRSDGMGECWVSEVKSRFGKPSKHKSARGSIGQVKKDKSKKKQKGEEEEEGAGEDVFAEDQPTKADDDDQTDISAFVEVFASRGFVLKQETVDKSNKMFVKMEFTKYGEPKKGKWANPNGQVEKKTPYKKWGFSSIPKDIGMTAEEESKVLKPCVYKLR
ncbi:ribosomal RNA-processing protein 8 [Nannizzia gypsea CBS 118893]|uniref:Ribosomal RNA-processing protein 8 n=1 Tax=Arthroderma gypseum (strain ATCC MYA-4604 / CBS 118893) TaxID=535722 RepID=E4UPT6_ARTGP|nr:rRNA processing protein RRP8 [Nannizzia gypsea CBS 118893]EFQ99908.1 ribosomal RNA-processing protein 8 [Nannizzia gypsea CBS 118893]